jgi:hypothetical protein
MRVWTAAALTLAVVVAGVCVSDSADKTDRRSRQ